MFCTDYDRQKDNFAYSYMTMREMLDLRRNGTNIARFFNAYGYKNIVIYGAGQLGIMLYEDLSDSDIYVMCFVDQNYRNFCNGLCEKKVTGIAQIPKEADIIVVSNVFYYNSIVDSLTDNCIPLEKIISLNDIVFSDWEEIR